MEACFNELSVYPYCADLEEVNRRVDVYVHVVKGIFNLGLKKIRYEHGLSNVMLTEDLSLAQYCFDRKNKDRGDFLMSCVKKPYIDENSEEEDKFTQYDDVYLKKTDDSLVPCYGFYAAFLYKSFCVGFYSNPDWSDSSFKLQLVKNKKIKEVTVFCISKKCEFNNSIFIEWAIDNIAISIPKTTILPDDKDVALRADHGFDILTHFVARLRPIPYVVSVINSLPFNPHEKNFIHNVYEDGKIELVLPDTDKGLGLVISTTASNLLETKWIAKYLKNHFGY